MLSNGYIMKGTCSITREARGIEVKTILLSAVMLIWGACSLWAVSAGEGAIEHMRYLDNGTIRVGIDLDLGGAITYLSKSGSDVNLINSYDWGRQIQMSHYSGPVPFKPRGKQPDPAWVGLGWNPIQSGDCFGHRSRVTAFHSDGATMYVKCIPMQWPLDNEPGECTFECRLSLEGNAVHVRSRLNNHRADTTQYRARDQELPAVYTNAPWYRLMTYAGDKPFTHAPLTQIGANFPWSNWRGTENWAALMDDNDFGVGIYEPGVTHFLGGFAGEPGKGGPKDAPTGYIAPTCLEVLDHDIQYTYHYDLIVGSLESIRSYVYEHAPRPSPPVYRFQRDRQHWYYVNAVDTGWPIRGELKVSLEKQNPQLTGPAGFWEAATAPKLKVQAAFPAGITHLRVFWTRPDNPNFNETCVRTFNITADGKYRDYLFDLSESPEYRGVITGLRLDPVTDGLPGSYAHIKKIGFR